MCHQNMFQFAGHNTHCNPLDISSQDIWSISPDLPASITCMHTLLEGLIISHPIFTSGSQLKGFHT